MIKPVQNTSPLVFLIGATILEVTGDALVRIAIYEHAGLARIAFGLIGAILLLFIVWQVINAIFFRTFPNLPIALGGALIVAGGLIVTFWKPEFSK
jgi:hypothetical protein